MSTTLVADLPWCCRARNRLKLHHHDERVGRSLRRVAALADAGLAGEAGCKKCLRSEASLCTAAQRVQLAQQLAVLVADSSLVATAMVLDRLNCHNESDNPGSAPFSASPLDGHSFVFGVVVAPALTAAAVRGRMAALVAAAATILVVDVKSTGPPPPPPPSSYGHSRKLSPDQEITNHLELFSNALDATTACRPPVHCTLSWIRREKAWRRQALAAEQLRLEQFGRWTGTLLPTQRNPALVGIFDLWEADMMCADEARIPLGVGDGPKWVCGPSARVTLRRRVARLELRRLVRARHARRCGLPRVYRRSDLARAAPRSLQEEVRQHGARVNASVGVGDAGSVVNAVVPVGKGVINVSFPLVSVRALLYDRYGWRPGQAGHLSAVKIDIEGHEWTTLLTLFDMCETDGLRIDVLNVELHLSPARAGGARGARRRVPARAGVRPRAPPQGDEPVGQLPGHDCAESFRG